MRGRLFELSLIEDVTPRTWKVAAYFRQCLSLSIAGGYVHGEHSSTTIDISPVNTCASVIQSTRFCIWLNYMLITFPVSKISFAKAAANQEVRAGESHLQSMSQDHAIHSGLLQRCRATAIDFSAGLLPENLSRANYCTS
jgi:hypothetical protein